ncbi:DNA gyrase subunit A [Paeniglutamicibacter sp. R2-26]|uniref:DNA gyrase subunit A n=1 Tax=Paeniglutamicibacter sp. R2-26 TaxID=3144417 RepID=UPI003EE713AB
MDANKRENTRASLELLEVLLCALDHREEIFQAIETAETHEESVRAVGKILGVGEFGAHAVLDMQIRRWTAHERRRIATHIEVLRGELAAP